MLSKALIVVNRSAAGSQKGSATESSATNKEDLQAIAEAMEEDNPVVGDTDAMANFLDGLL